MEDDKAKPFVISKWLVYNAYKAVKENRGSAGIDNITIEEYDKKITSNLYKKWNRMSSGTYFPKAVKLVEIPKANGGKRPLGIPSVEDRTAQMVVVKTIEERLEVIFHEDSYGYRLNKSAHDAVKTAKERCWKRDWALDMDISKFFDTIDHELLMKAVKCHVQEKWILLYIERWLKVPYQLNDGSIIERTMGVPQGSVIGPILANLYLHYTFDKLMQIHYPNIPFERYADDTICHCRTEKQAKFLFYQLQERFAQCKLKLNAEKTKIVYCQDDRKSFDKDKLNNFDFLCFTFRPRMASTKDHKSFVGFLPAISNKSIKKINTTIRTWTKKRLTRADVNEMAEMMNPSIQGWINYYGKFYPSRLKRILQNVNRFLYRWAKRKYKSLVHKKSAIRWVAKLAMRDKYLFAHWCYGVVPSIAK